MQQSITVGIREKNVTGSMISHTIEVGPLLI